MKKIFIYALLIVLFSFTILFMNQSLIKAATLNNITTMDELKAVFGEKATIEENTIKLTENITIKNTRLDIEIPELVVDFNGKTIECTEDGTIHLYKKVTFKDTSTTNREEWGGIIFNQEASSIKIETGAEVIIENGKFVDFGVSRPKSMIVVTGKLTINDADFSTKRLNEIYTYNYMMELQENSEVVINGGEYIHTNTIIKCGTEDSNRNNCKLTINGGHFKSTGSETISIDTLYPYIDKENKKEVITPTIILDNCTVESTGTAIAFEGGCTDEEFRNEDTKILTILGGTYISTSDTLDAAFTIYSNILSKCYFNPKDFVLENGTFKTVSKFAGAIKLSGPGKRRLYNYL